MQLGIYYNVKLSIKFLVTTFFRLCDHFSIDLKLYILCVAKMWMYFNEDTNYIKTSVLKQEFS